MFNVAAKLEAQYASRPGNDENLPYDREALELLSELLAQHMTNLCADMGYTRFELDESMLPSDFYKTLPKS